MRAPHAGAARVPRPPSRRARSRLTSLLAGSRDALLGATAALAPDEWAARAAPDRWSPRDIVEHLVLTETAVSPRVLRADAAAAATAAAAAGGDARGGQGRSPRVTGDRRRGARPRAPPA